MFSVLDNLDAETRAKIKKQSGIVPSITEHNELVPVSRFLERVGLLYIADTKEEALEQFGAAFDGYFDDYICFYHGFDKPKSAYDILDLFATFVHIWDSVQTYIFNQAEPRCAPVWVGMLHVSRGSSQYSSTIGYSVFPPFRGAGIAQKLVNWYSLFLNSPSNTRIELIVDVRNKHGLKVAQDLEVQGFTLESRMTNYYGGGHDALMFVCVQDGIDLSHTETLSCPDEEVSVIG